VLLLGHFSNQPREVTNTTMSTGIDTGALQDIKGMAPKMMKILIEEGFTTPHQVAMASPDDLTRVQGISDNKARQVIYAAREQLGMCEFVSVDQVKENYEWFTTGSENVDDLMDGGITTGRITEIFGDFKSPNLKSLVILYNVIRVPSPVNEKRKRKQRHAIQAISIGRPWCVGISAFPQPGPIQHTSISLPLTFLMAIGLPQWFGASCVVPHFWHFKVTALGQSAGGFIPIPFIGFIMSRSRFYGCLVYSISIMGFP